MTRSRPGGLLLAAILALASCAGPQASPGGTGAGASPTSPAGGPTEPAAPTAGEPTAGEPTGAPTGEPTAGEGSPAAGTGAPQAETSLRVMGFEVPANERGTPLDQAYQQFLDDFRAANPAIAVESLETPPEADTQILVDLSAGTGPDVWQQDASSLAKYVDAGVVLDMRRCMEVYPQLDLERFFPNVLAINQREDGSIYGLPNDFTPMMIFLSNPAFENAGVDKPQEGWTWDDLVDIAKRTTLDGEGRDRDDPAFDESDVVQWGYRVRQFAFEWIYRLWENGGDVLSPDGTTASGFLDSPQSIEAIQFHADLLLEHGVSPEPSVLDQMDQQLGFLDRFVNGEFAMFDRGHWELFGLMNTEGYEDGSIDVVGQPSKATGDTVIYQATWAVNASVADDPAKLQGACTFVDAATSPQYQDTKVITGIAISSTPDSAEKAFEESETPEIEEKFQAAVENGRPPWGSRIATYPAIELILDSMMERILNGSPVADEVASATEEINRELGP